MWLLLVVLLFTGRAAYAQPAAPQQVGVWGGASVASGGLIAPSTTSRLSLGAVRYQRRLLPAFTSAALLYTLDALPWVVLHIPGRNFTTPRTPPGRVPPARRVRGVGLVPAGLQLNLRPRRAVQPFISGSVGFVYFFEVVPDTKGLQMNFSADLGAGVAWHPTRPWTLQLGYRYHHLSNGFRGVINPGFDVHFLYAGVLVAL